jgi:hypothetical protein
MQMEVEMERNEREQSLDKDKDDETTRSGSIRRRPGPLETSPLAGPLEIFLGPIRRSTVGLLPAP